MMERTTCNLYTMITINLCSRISTSFNNMIAAGVVLTGGGARMEGATELAEEVFSMPVRLGTAQYVAGLVEVVRNPIYATSVGLLVHGKRRGRQPAAGAQRKLRLDLPENLWARMKAWFRDGF